MTDAEIAQKHAIDMQILAVSCARSYGMLALGGLLILNAIGLMDFERDYGAFALGAMLAILGAAFAYGNFTAIASGWTRAIVPLMGASIGCGVGSALMFLQGAF